MKRGRKGWYSFTEFRKLKNFWARHDLPEREKEKKGCYNTTYNYPHNHPSKFLLLLFFLLGVEREREKMVQGYHLLLFLPCHLMPIFSSPFSAWFIRETKVPINVRLGETKKKNYRLTEKYFGFFSCFVEEREWESSNHDWGRMSFQPPRK